MILIKVDYQYIDGSHVFTTNDVDGFLVASPLPQKAVGDIENVLVTLLKHNHKVSVKNLTELQSMQDFMNESYLRGHDDMVLKTCYYAVELEAK